MANRFLSRISLGCLLALGCRPDAQPLSTVEAQPPGRGREGSAPVIARAPRSALGADAIAVALGDSERFAIPVDPHADPIRGPLQAPVTVVFYYDYECPFSWKLNEVLEQLLREYPSRVRVVYKQFPLTSIHPKAMDASRAMLAAHSQGGFGRLHQAIMEPDQNGSMKLDLDRLVRLASELGLDRQRFDAERHAPQMERRVLGLIEQGGVFAVRSTPSFFVNGIPGRGAKPIEAMREMVEDELRAAERLVAIGGRPDRMYDAVMQVGQKARAAPAPKKRSPRPGQPKSELSYAVPVDGRPFRGPENALVTIVEFGDFQCPYTARVQDTLSRLQTRYPNEVRVVFRHHPLPFHKQAKLAARAAWAAERQGKFWRMHDQLFEHAKELSREKILNLASKLGLNRKRFARDMDSQASEVWVEEDTATAMIFGAKGTPAFFVNGRFLSGAQPLEAFVALVDEEMAKASRALAARGGARDNFYGELIRGFETKADGPAPKPVADEVRRNVVTAGLPRRGPKNAPVQMLMCADFGCPYCRRAVETMGQLQKAFPKKIALYFRNFPLPMHKTAGPVHLAAIAAHRQGKFWKFWKLAYERWKLHSDDEIRETARLVGLDMKRFERDWKSQQTAQQLADDLRICQELGTRGVPSFFVNGRHVAGAQPLPRFEKIIEEELSGGFEAAAKRN